LNWEKWSGDNFPLKITGFVFRDFFPLIQGYELSVVEELSFLVSFEEKWKFEEIGLF
jgi:hypothetical protein